MNVFQLALFILISSASLFANDRDKPEHVLFYDATVEEAVALAGVEGKLAFIEFYADWCSPCKWMDQTTFANPTVSNYMNEHYVSAKINIDDFEGFTAKEQYNVSALPTMLIFNSKGQMVERVEETLAPSKLMNLLKRHNHESNTKVVIHQINSSPKADYKTQYTKRNSRTTNSGASSFNHSTSTAPTAKSSNYRVKLATFLDEEGANNFYGILKRTFADPIIILQAAEHGKMVFHVLMGDFQTKKEAQDYKIILETQFDMEGSVY